MFLPFLKDKRPNDSKHEQEGFCTLAAGNCYQNAQVLGLNLRNVLHFRWKKKDLLKYFCRREQYPCSLSFSQMYSLLDCATLSFLWSSVSVTLAIFFSGYTVSSGDAQTWIDRSCVPQRAQMAEVGGMWADPSFRGLRFPQGSQPSANSTQRVPNPRRVLSSGKQMAVCKLTAATSGDHTLDLTLWYKVCRYCNLINQSFLKR